MKNKIFTLIVSLVLGYTSYGQNYTKEEYSHLSDLFAKDVALMKNVKDIGSKSISQSQGIFLHSRIMRLYPDPNDVDWNEKLLIIVDSAIYSKLSFEIDRYAYDAFLIHKYEIIVEKVKNANHVNVKNLIFSNESNLKGVVLIGDIPAAWYQVPNDHNKYGYADWPCDLYYMDLNGSWGDANNDAIFDSHSGNVMPEIFIGRISTANMGQLVSEEEGLRKYLNKNHLFWIGKLPVNQKYGLAYTDADWDDIDYFKMDIGLIYLDAPDVILYKDNTSNFGKTDYLNRLSNNRYEFIQLASHSSYDYHALSGGNLYANEIFNKGTEAIGYNLFCCSACRWTSVGPSSQRGFIGGAYIYNSNTSGLVVVGSTKTGSMLNFAGFYSPLYFGKSFGDALLKWWENVGYTHSMDNIYWYYGLSIIGDPLINLAHSTNEVCQNEVVLNTFDSFNMSNIQYYLAKNKIRTTSGRRYVVPAGKYFILNAPVIELNDGFETQNGSVINLINDGCGY